MADTRSAKPPQTALEGVPVHPHGDHERIHQRARRLEERRGPLQSENATGALEQDDRIIEEDQ